MEAVKDTKVPPQADSQERATYPYDTIKSSLDLMEKIVSIKGTGQYSTRKEISIMLGKAEATLVMKLSSCIQYGILINKFGVGYIPTDLFNEYIEPVYEHDKKKVIVKMLLNPPFYKTIIDDLNGKILPNEGGLVNLFKNNYKLIPTSAERAAKALWENLRFAGVIDSNNRLRVIAPTEMKTSPPIDEGEKEQLKIADEYNRKSASANRFSDNDLFKLPIPLPNNRIAYLEYPRTDLSKKDINVIKLAIAFIEGSLPDEGVQEKKEL
jgi:hypothetical protein